MNNEIKACPFCGELPEIDTAGTSIYFMCCCDMTIQKSDYMTMAERKTWDDDLLKYSDAVEEKVLCVIFDKWNSRPTEAKTLTLEAYKECFEKFIPTDKWDEATAFLSTYGSGLAKDMLRRNL